MAQVDKDYIKLRLDTQKLHQDFLNFLQGTRTIIEYDEETQTYTETTQAIGEPLANEEGVQALLSFVISIVNPHTIQGNTDKPDYHKILHGMELGLAARLTLNYEAWGIETANRDQIIDTIMYMIQLILSRTIGNLERESYSVGIEKTSRYTSPKQKTGKVI